jgi:hypothetical protein
MLTPLEALEAMIAQSYEHLDVSDPTTGGIYTVQKSLGLDPSDAEDITPKLVAMVQTGMPLESALLGAFVAGVLWKDRQE